MFRRSFIVFLILSGCAGNEMNYEKYGIHIMDLSKDNYVIVDKNGDTIVYNKIVKFCKKNNKIIGFRIYFEGDNAIDAPEFRKNTGYFELNMINKSVYYNSEYGITEVNLACFGENIIE